MSLRTDSPQLQIGNLCELFGYTKQAYYQNISRKCIAEAKDDITLQLVLEIRKDMPKLGTRKIHYILRDKYDVDIGRDHLFDIMRDNDLLSRKHKRKYKTTYSAHNLRTYPNAIIDVVPSRPNEIWVSDITYIIFGYTFKFLFLITDAYSKKIIGWKYSDSLATDNAIFALKMALKQRKGKEHLIHHSDRGTQYCASRYIALLAKHKILPSMTESGDPRENGIAERVNGILKQEFIEQCHDITIENAESKIAMMIEIYNNKRPHLSLGMLTPSQAHQMNGEQNRLWKIYYQNKEKTITQNITNFALADNKDDDHLDRSP